MLCKSNDGADNDVLILCEAAEGTCRRGAEKGFRKMPPGAEVEVAVTAAVAIIVTTNHVDAGEERGL